MLFSRINNLPRKRARMRQLVRFQTSSSSSLDFCVNLVKRRDYENFLATLLLPKGARQSAFAIRAFNVEVSDIRDSVSEKAIGLMRMKFWTEAIEQIFAGQVPPKQPVALQLARAVRTHRNLSKDLFLRIISSRETFLSNKPFSTVDEVDEYGRDAFSSINYLLLECLKSEKEMSGHLRHSANQLGKAQGMVTLLRGVPFNASKRRVYLPTELMSGHGVSSEDVIRAKNGDQLKLVVESLAARAQDHLDNCRFRAKHLTREEKVVLLPAVSIDCYLDSLYKAKCNIFDASLQTKNSWLPFLLYYNKFKASY